MLSVVMLSVIMLSGVMLSVIMLSVVMLSVVMLSVIMLGGAAPTKASTVCLFYVFGSKPILHDPPFVLKFLEKIKRF
jgi:hypothetical protein